MSMFFLGGDEGVTDYNKLKKLFTELGIGFEEITSDKQGENRRVIECYEGNSKIIGYGSFYTDFYFTMDGAFIEMGVWE